MRLLAGKVAIITGAGQGIGRAHALAFAKEGARVVVNDLGTDPSGDGVSRACADAVVDEITQAGGQAVPNYDSVATMAGGESIIRTAIDAFGRIDILVNNAGILRDKSFGNMTEEMWDAVINVHLKGTFACTKPAVEHMRAQGTGGRIINTSSTSGLIGNFGQSNYGAAKAGIAGLTRVLAIELIKYGITVNCIVPTALTRMTEELPMFQGVGQKYGPEHVAPVAVFLASDLAKDITGKFVGVGGGRISAFDVRQTPGVRREGIWTPHEIADRINEILNVW